MKKIRIGIMMLFFCILCFFQPKSLQAAVTTGKCGDNVTYRYNSSTRILTLSGSGKTYGYNYYDSPVRGFDMIKVEIENGVTELGEHLFAPNDTMEEITFANSVISIKKGVFNTCTALKKVHFTNNLVNIGEYIFAGATGLEEITIPGSVTQISNNAFNSCKGLKTIHITNGVARIGEYSFAGCESLESISLPASISEIGENAFNSCKKIEFVNLSNGISKIGGYAFAGCTSLTTINFPDSITEIGDDAFNTCESLKAIKIPSGMKTIHEFAFAACLSLTKVELPSSITTIEAGAFNSCKSLQKITIPNSVSKMGNRVFRYCYTLKEITIPAKVKKIEKYSFLNCYSLSKVVIKNKSISIDKNAFGYNFDGDENSATTNPNIIFYGYQNSTTQKFANKYKIGFQNIDQKMASKTSISSLSSSKKDAQIQAKWKKVSKAYQYEVQIYGKANKHGYKEYVRVITKKNSLKLKKNKNLKKGTTYYVRVRAYAKRNGKQIISPWSAVKKLKMKK